MKKQQKVSLTKKAKMILAGVAVFTLTMATGIGYSVYKADLEMKRAATPPAGQQEAPAASSNSITIDPTKKEQTIDINGRKVPVKVVPENQEGQKK